MLSETFITSIRAQQKSANTAISKDIGIYIHSLHPTFSVKSTFKNSSTHANSLAVSSTHIFAAQANKAVLHVYSRDRGNQEALISFPERIHSLVLINDALLALGTAEGRIIFWEICTGRQASTPTSHLQLVSSLAATKEHLISGSDDSNIHVWSIPNIMSLSATAAPEPIRSLSNHRATITALIVGKSSSRTNICISASKDNTCLIWNYHTGDLLRTYLLPSTPLSLALDPCERAFYVGFEDGSIQCINLFDPAAVVNTLHDAKLQSTPVQVNPEPFSGAPATLGATHCLEVSYDGSSLISGHESGKIVQWDAGPRKYFTELADLNAPVNNLKMISPFPDDLPIKAVNVVKPRLGEAMYTYTGQFTNDLAPTKFEDVLRTPGFPSDVLEEAILEFYAPAQISSAGDGQLLNETEKLRKENEELWKIVNEQRALQKRTFDKYREAKS